jgi:hypothetical protein
MRLTIFWLPVDAQQPPVLQYDLPQQPTLRNHAQQPLIHNHAQQDQPPKTEQQLRNIAAR